MDRIWMLRDRIFISRYEIRDRLHTLEGRAKQWFQKHAASVILALIPITVASIIWFHASFPDVIGQLTRSNESTLIAEILVGISVSLLMLWVAKRNETELQNKVDKMQDNLTRVMNASTKKQTLTYTKISKSLYSAKSITEKILIKYKEYDNPQGGNQAQPMAEILDLQKDLSDLSEKEFDKIISVNGDQLHDETYAHIVEISKLCKNKPNFSKRNPVADSAFYIKLLYRISDVVVNLMNVFPRYPEDHAFGVSCDRLVYPAGSKIYPEAYASEAEYGAPIRFELFDSRLDLIDVKITNAWHGNPLDQRYGIHGVTFRMSKDLSKVDEEYIVRASCGDRQAEDSFVIDQRESVIQVDKEVYAAGDDMIVTVIDPDSDKDSDAPEYVGDREDSKLIIESEDGRIEGYRLLETGDSTAIFQGVVGILGVRDDGTVVPHRFGGLVIDKTQGIGIEDGYIAVRPGGMITITYKYGSRSERLECFVSDGPLPQETGGA